MKIALAQISVSKNISDNEEKILEVFSTSIEKNVRLVVFPEYSLSGPPSQGFVSSRATNIKLIRRSLSTIAKRLKNQSLHAIIPTLYYEKGWRSSAFYFNPEKRTIKRRDKVILSSNELELLVPGDKFWTFTIDGFRFSIILCAEGNGPELIVSHVRTGVDAILHVIYPDNLQAKVHKIQNDLWKAPLEDILPMRHRIRALTLQVNILTVIAAGCGAISRAITPYGDNISKLTNDKPEISIVDMDLSSYPFRRKQIFLQRLKAFQLSLKQLKSTS